MNKKTLGLLVTVLVLGVPAIYILGQQATTPTGGPVRVRESQVLQDVQRQIQKLEQQLTVLEKKVETLETNLNRGPIVVHQPPVLPGQELPLGSKPYNYNGTTYYFVPLGDKVAPDENHNLKPRK